MSTKTEANKKPDRTPADHSPENDLKKAIVLLASARSKFIKKLDENKGSGVLELIQKAEALAGKAS